jgi:hypothetical protein
MMVAVVCTKITSNVTVELDPFVFQVSGFAGGVVLFNPLSRGRLTGVKSGHE